MIKRYVKRPIEVEAVQWRGDNKAEIIEFAGSVFHALDEDERTADLDATALVRDHLHNSWIFVYTGDWILKGIKGEFYPCNSEVFENTYDEVTT